MPNNNFTDNLQATVTVSNCQIPIFTEKPRIEKNANFEWEMPVGVNRQSPELTVGCELWVMAITRHGNESRAS